MKTLAQHGSMEGDKIVKAVERDLLSGAVYSPRDVSFQNLERKLAELAEHGLDRFFDPQLYTCFLAGSGEARVGHLLDDEYSEYFSPYRRSELEREAKVRDILDATIGFQLKLDVTGIIAPNILIPRSFDSIEAVVAKNFVRDAASRFRATGDKRPVFASLVISREALTESNKREMSAFLDDVTLLDEPPDGFYVIVAARSSLVRSDIFNSDVIAGWMFLNHVLNLNGFQVVNGYSDLLAPFLSAAGGAAGATGWWSNLATFSLEKFGPSPGGGRRPVPRYLSTGLLNRITFFELNQLRELVPDVLNGLPTDDIYPEELESEPESSEEVLQAWDAIRDLNAKVEGLDQKAALRECLAVVGRAGELYDEIPLSLDQKSRGDHLAALEEGITLFARHAEIEIADE